MLQLELTFTWNLNQAFYLLPLMNSYFVYYIALQVMAKLNWCHSDKEKWTLH